MMLSEVIFSNLSESEVNLGFRKCVKQRIVAQFAVNLEFAATGVCSE
jgi:hypothetical protein